MLHQLPPFEPVTMAELRRLYSRATDPEVKRLILEVVRYRQVMADIDRYCTTIQHAWRDNVGGNLVALHLLHGVMSKERLRTPS